MTARFWRRSSFVATTRCAWRQLPPIFGASWQTIRRCFSEWSKARAWAKTRRILLDELGSQGTGPECDELAPSVLPARWIPANGNAMHRITGLLVWPPCRQKCSALCMPCSPRRWARRGLSRVNRGRPSPTATGKLRPDDHDPGMKPRDYISRGFASPTS
ncbi:hypothetical protein [Planotetraspora silvatica]|uniref:hypothetical protein n=1 Tax=Planotetraspora silvatica TaxID=234614 RepID=UPI003570A4F6